MCLNSNSKKLLPCRFFCQPICPDHRNVLEINKIDTTILIITPNERKQNEKINLSILICIINFHNASMNEIVNHKTISFCWPFGPRDSGSVGKPIMPHLLRYQGFAVVHYSVTLDALYLGHPRLSLNLGIIIKWGHLH